MFRLLPFIVFCMFLVGCGSKGTFVLLPDSNGSVGEIEVTNAQGSQTLNQARQSVTVASKKSNPSDIKTIEEEKIQSLFGRAIDIQPLPPEKFLLYFNFDSIQLGQESREVLPQIIQVVKDRESKDISINGHTDRAGDAEYNFSLSMRRAQHIQSELEKLDVNPAIMTSTSHGEGNPLYPTADNKAEPRNRRVEVIIR